MIKMLDALCPNGHRREYSVAVMAGHGIPDLIQCEAPGCDEYASTMPGGNVRPWRGVKRSARLSGS